jgi:DNA-binding NarL/FixJ family response regulator
MKADGADDNPVMDAGKLFEILDRYSDHVRRFEDIAAQRGHLDHRLGGELVSLQRPRRELDRGPTKRELEVLGLIAEGLTGREIADRLFLSEETVRKHVRGLLEALEVHTRAHAVAVGFRRGIIA